MVARDLHDGDIATSPDWNDGKPVRITRNGDNVRWQDIGAHERAHQLSVGDTTDITLQARRDHA